MSRSCHLTIQRTEDGYLFRISGSGTMRESPTVRDFICGALTDGANVIVDLSECVFLDSTFLGCLVMTQQHGQQHAGQLHLFAPDSVRQQLMGTMHLDRVLEWADVLPAELGEAVTLHVTPLERREFCHHLLTTHRKLAELGGDAADTFQRIVDQLQKEYEALPPP